MATKKDIESAVEQMVKPIVAEHHFECVDVEYVKEAGTWYLRVYIDKEGGITVNDCEIVSRALDLVIEENDPVGDAYILEVSSPGLDRPLKKEKDFQRSIGKDIEIKLYKTVNGSKEHIGALESYTSETVVITNDDGQLTFERKDIAIIRLAVIF